MRVFYRWQTFQKLDAANAGPETLFYTGSHFRM